jgi:hypothetical protein
MRGSGRKVRGVEGAERTGGKGREQRRWEGLEGDKRKGGLEGIERKGGDGRKLRERVGLGRSREDGREQRKRAAGGVPPDLQRI